MVHGASKKQDERIDKCSIQSVVHRHRCYINTVNNITIIIAAVESRYSTLNHTQPYSLKRATRSSSAIDSE
jgi:hypothetical protein